MLKDNKTDPSCSFIFNRQSDWWFPPDQINRRPASWRHKTQLSSSYFDQKLSPNSRGGVVGNEQGVGVWDEGCNKKTRWCRLHITTHVSAILQQVCAHTVHVLCRQNPALSSHVPCHFGWRTSEIVVGRTGGGANVHNWVSDWFAPGRVEHFVFLFWPVHDATDLSSHKGRWIYGSIEDTTQAARQNPVNGPGRGMDPVKLIGVAHLNIFARCPVVIIQGPGVIGWWSLAHWSAKISWADVIRNDIPKHGIGRVEGIAPIFHVLVFTTQVKVRVHVDQIGELIIQTSEMIPNSSNTLNGFQLTTALNNSWTEIYIYWVFFPILVLRCFTALITCSSRNKLCDFVWLIQEPTGFTFGGNNPTKSLLTLRGDCGSAMEQG